MSRRDPELEEKRTREALHRNVPYTEPGGIPLLMDVYRPPVEGPVPVVVWFHGGGWKSGNKDRCTVRWFVRYGYAVAAVSYRLLPRHTHPAQLEDGRAAVAAVLDRADAFGLDPNRIVLGGESAGAWIAMMVALTGLDTPGHLDTPDTLDPVSPPARKNPVAAVVNVSGFADFAALQSRPDRRPGRGSPESKLLRLGPDARPSPEALAALSPVAHVAAAAAAEMGPLPVFVHVHGTENSVVPADQSRRIHNDLRAVGGTSKLVEMQGIRHGDPRLLSERGARGRVVDFLNAHLGQPRLPGD